MLLFLVQASKHRLVSVLPTFLTVFAGAILSLSVKVVEDDYRPDSLFSPQVSFLIQWLSSTQESTARPELGVLAGRVSIHREPSASHDHGLEATCEDASFFIFNPAADLLIECIRA